MRHPESFSFRRTLTGGNSRTCHRRTARRSKHARRDQEERPPPSASVGLTPDSEPGAVKASRAGVGAVTPAFPERPFTPGRVMTPCPGLGCSIRRAARQRTASGARIRTLPGGDASVSGVHRKQRRRAYADRPPALKGSRCQTTISCSFKLSRHTAMPYSQLVQAHVDREVTEEAAVVLAAMGLTVSDAVRLLLSRIAREKALPFSPLVPNAPPSRP